MCCACMKCGRRETFLQHPFARRIVGAPTLWNSKYAHKCAYLEWNPLHFCTRFYSSRQLSRLDLPTFANSSRLFLGIKSRVDNPAFGGGAVVVRASEEATEEISSSERRRRSHASGAAFLCGVWVCPANWGASVYQVQHCGASTQSKKYCQAKGRDLFLSVNVRMMRAECWEFCC